MISRPLITMPLPEPSGFVRTLNGTGYMTTTIDPCSRRLIDHAILSTGPLLDVGAAYGVATLDALNRGCTVIANDLDSRHLQILWERTPLAMRGRLSLKPGRFPDELAFEANALGTVLICRVMHFFDGATIERSLRLVYQWLAPHGQIAIVAETPYLRNFQRFIPIYEQRKVEGVLWPGFVDNVQAIAPERGKSLPPQMHFLDMEVLTRVLVEVGFRVEHAVLMSRTDFPEDLRLDGRESVGVIGQKPQ